MFTSVDLQNMDGVRLYETLKLINERTGNKHTIGVFASDKIPRRFIHPASFIINTDNSRNKGIHWISIYVTKRGSIEYFDSYGLPPLIEDHLAFLTDVKSSYKTNRMQLQSLTSSVCGLYCLLYLTARMHNKSLKTFQSIFSKNTTSNDKKVTQLYAKLLKLMTK